MEGTGNSTHNSLDTSSSRPALKICILDGFLLYTDSMTAVQKHIDVKYFLQVSYKKSKARREARAPYVLRDGSVWQDPPGYFDKIVWSNYVEEHGWMFEDNDVNGKMKRDALREAGIGVLSDRGPDVDMGTTLNWAVESLIRELTNLVAE
jgi:nicotinamide/nicotinate riboside kinase